MAVNRSIGRNTCGAVLALKTRNRGVALPVSLILVAVALVVGVALLRAARQDLAVSGSEADRTFATEATDAALRSMLTELQALPGIPEIVDPSGATLPWWNKSNVAITPAFWVSCATAPPGARCVGESKTNAGRTYQVQRTVQPNGTPDEISATSGAFSFYYRVAVLVTLDTGARAEIESYVRRPQLVKS